ncbi:glycerol-3-phosphate 1-O-acyltransferase PlsY [Candidatus Paracaedibacter symbiosus]|uniref:glycerol-3-phosphate 1-O-acyltransferase PlsY n=1 Tax=Candidatus Paracaedibacter symbiosus TaxID=244582 RepID=UPI000509AA0F|nr:glycerol-3-phosphate 1-O-acyltransferase PlsY [Candidatus Paracaedibacter symbiosus]
MEHLYLYAIAYLLGSIPFGLLFVKMAGKGDIRNLGSGNIGTTNVLRTGSKSLAAATLIADALKGAVPVVIAKYLVADETIQCLVGGAAILGHIFPVWLKFKGGKGVATTLGVYLTLCPIVGLLTLFTWIIAAKVARISSLSALIALFMAAIYAVFLVGRTDIVVFTMAIYFLMAWTHRANIKRLLSGQERKF